MNNGEYKKFLTIDEIHKIRERNFEITKSMNNADKNKYYNEKGHTAQKVIESIKACKL